MSSRYAHLGSGTTTAQHSNPCDTPVIHGGCSTNLLHRLTDRSAYGALVADACEFNRGLSRGRASRLPFVDTATRTTQRPAPWLYRPQCDRFKDAADDGTHIVLRYLRHRWRLDNPPLSRRRKLAADRLWYTLQTSLNGLGVPAELIPVVTQRAYAIAGLPIPPLWANSLDSALSRQAPASHPNGPFNGTLISSNSAMNSTVAGNAVGVSGRISSSSVPGTMSSKRFSSSVSEPVSTDIGRKAHSRVGVGGADDESELVDETTTSNDGPISRSRSAANQEENNASLAVVFSGGEESGHSNETGAAAGASSGPLRRSGTSHICPDEETRTDDEAQSVQSGPGGGTVMATRASAAAAKTYDIDPDVESDDDDDDQAGDGDGDDDAEMDDELDDAEWIQPSRRRSTRGFASRRAFNSSRASRALAGSSKSSRFGVSGGRLSGRHIGSGQRTLGGRHKSRNSRAELTGLFGTITTTPSASTSTSSNIAGSGSGSGTIGRRSTRLAVSSTQGAKISSTASGMRDVDKQNVESWDKYDEPGFQPNANLNPLPDRADESHRLLPDPVGTVGTCFAHTRASSLVPGPPVSEGIQLTSESNSQNSSVTTQYMDQSRRHLAATGLSSAIGTSATTTNTGGGNVTASTGSTTAGNINGYPLSSTPHSNSAPFLSNQKSSTMAQLLASTNNTASTSAVSTITSSVGASTVPLYDYHNMISTDSNVRESNAHGSEWSAITSSSTSVGPPTKLMKDAVGAPGTPASRSMSDYPSMAEQPSPLPRSTAASSGLTAAAAVGSSSSSGNPAGDPFASPTGATTTVTFFVCEVCASRYRSTAGLRYHYHSQHSGYSPKNPISASASRLVVPVGEERGIGGGLRGGRPRRNKGNTVDARGSRGHKTKDNELKSYGDMILGSLGSVRTGTGDMQTGSNSMDAFKEPNAIQSSSSDPSSTFSPNYLASSSNGCGTNGNARIPNESSPASRGASFYRGSSSYSPKPQLGANGMLDDNMKSPGNLTATTTPLTSMGIMANAFNSSTSDGSGLIELNCAINPQRIHSSSLEMSSRAEISGSSSSTNNPMGSLPSYHTVSWTGSNPYGSGSTLSQMGPVDAVPPVGVSAFSRLTPSQRRRYERQHCPDRINPGGRVGPGNSTGCPPGNGPPHCVYCLGDDRLNPRLGRAESLLRCYRCAQWAHFSCLRLPPHVIEAATRYPWQCIECKTCWLCGSPEEEHRMVLCVDCDRAFHIDCLPSPLPRIAEGSWSCDICLHEIYAIGKSAQGGDKFVPIPSTTTTTANMDPSSNNNSSSSSSYYLLKDH